MKAIHQTNPDGTLNGNTIAKNADDVLLAVPVDINDLTAGFQRIESGAAGEDSSGKGKGKANANGPTSVKKVGVNGKNAILDCPQGAGMRDGGIVAFKFRDERDVVDEDEDEEMDLDDIRVTVGGSEKGKREEWDVVVPSMEETYGEGGTAGEVAPEGGGEGG